MAKRRISLRDLVVRRALARCEYCRSPAAFAHQSFSLEHIRPRSRTGKRTPGNLALSCQGCNNHKYNRTKALDPVSQEMLVLFHPRRHRWTDHFAWTDDGTQILGLTAIGRATVEALATQSRAPGQSAPRSGGSRRTSASGLISANSSKPAKSDQKSAKGPRRFAAISNFINHLTTITCDYIIKRERKM